MAGLVLRQVSKVFRGGVKAIERVDLAVRDGELLVLLGPSGCGKTTLLRLIAGLETPTEGSIRIGDRAVDRLRPWERDVAMVFERGALYPHLTVRENLAFPLTARRGLGWLVRGGDGGNRSAHAAVPAAARVSVQQRVTRAAAMFHMEELLDRMPHELSGGQQRRVALGRAFVRQPAVFLLDEPLSNLDARYREAIRREIQSVHRQLRTTMVYVTHDQTEALLMGERIAVMDRGVIRQVGTPDELYEKPAHQSVAAAIGRLPMNMLPGRLTPYGGSWRFEGSDLTVPLSGLDGELSDDHLRDVTLGVRPHDVACEMVVDQAVENDHGRGWVRDVHSLEDRLLIEVEIAGSPTEANNGGGAVGAPSGNRLMWLASPRFPVSVGLQVAITLPLDRIHLFDGQTGRRIAATS